MSRSLGVSVLLAWLGVACAGPPPQPPVDFSVPLSRETLDNGLQLVVVTDTSAPVVTAMATFRAGAFAETPEQDGYSHLLEHMLFKGSAEVPDPLEFRDRLRGLGALSNATTGNDSVNFFYTLPRENLEAGLSLMAGALMEPTLDADALQDEIAVVEAEIDLLEADWERVHYRRFIELLYPDHPNRKSAIGRREVVQMATRQDLLDMHARYYTPGNALMILSGDVQADAGLALLRQALQDWPAQPSPFEDAPVPQHPPLEASVGEVITAPVQDAHLTVGWHGPSARTDPDAAVAADVLAELSRLLKHPFREIVGSPVVFGAGVDHSTGRYTGAITVELSGGLGHEREAVARLRDALRAMQRHVSEDLLHTAIDNVWLERFERADSAGSLAYGISREWGYGGLDYHQRYIERLYAVTRFDIAQLIERHVAGRPYAAVLLTSEDSAREGGLDAAWLRGAL